MGNRFTPGGTPPSVDPVQASPYSACPRRMRTAAPQDRQDAPEPGPGQLRPSLVTVDHGALRRNLSHVHRTCKKPVMAVVKAEAYGHGMEQVVRTLSEHPGLWGFAVATVDEGIRCRTVDHRRPVVILNGFLPGQARTVVERRLTPAVFRPEHIEELQRVARPSQPTPVHVKVDTGMHRLGAAPDQVRALCAVIHRTAALHLEGVYTHLSDAEGDDRWTGEQVQRFWASVPEGNQAAKLHHVSNSAHALTASQDRFDLVRAGLALYGYAPSQPVTPLQPVAGIHSHIVDLRSIEHGEPVGYGQAYRAVGRRAIATIPIGYGDGLSRKLWRRGQALLRGRFVPIAGRISMDLITLDVSDITPAVSLGERVTLLGHQGDASINAHHWHRWGGPSPYEAITQLTPRLPRVHLHTHDSDDRSLTRSQ